MIEGMGIDAEQSIFEIFDGYDTSLGRHAHNVNLEKFAHDFVNVCSLEVIGKLSREDADQEILSLWDTLQERRAGE